jgi:4-amino-4-deoxy-L-arabinose transferase-like glycosyltransferase
MERSGNASQAWNQMDSLALGGLLALGTLIRIPHLIAPYVINMDAMDYVKGAQAIAGGDLVEGLRLTHPSVYPILVALLHPLVGDWICAARILPVTFGILTIMPFYMLSRDLLGSGKAWLPVIFYTVCPTIVRNSLDVVREPIFWFTTALFLWLLLRAHRANRWGYYLLAGGMVLLCSSVRAEGLLLIPVGIGFALYTGIRFRKGLECLWNVSIFLLPMVILALAGFLLMPGPWRQGKGFDLPYYRRQLKVAVLGSNDMDMEVGKLVHQSASLQIKRFLALAWEKRRVLFAWDLMEHWVRAAHPLLFALMLLALPRRATWREPAWHLLAFVMIAWILLGCIRVSGAFAIGKRHLVPLVMAGYPYGARGLLHTVEWLSRRWPKIPRNYVSYGVVVVILMIILPESLKPIRQDKLIRREVGEWIRTAPRCILRRWTPGPYRGLFERPLNAGGYPGAGVGWGAKGSGG